jgi:hypothetical protein
MTDAVPEADALEQRQPLVDGDAPEQVPEIDVEVPEEDALEQRQPLLERDTPEQVPEIDIEVPEEDALEQAMPVPFDEDDAPR